MKNCTVGKQIGDFFHGAIDGFEFLFIDNYKRVCKHIEVFHKLKKTATIPVSITFW
jgi:hypothetical protein